MDNEHFIDNVKEKIEIFFARAENSQEHFDQIIRTIAQTVKMNLSSYRESYLKRRIYLRIRNLPQLHSFHDYYSYLQKHVEKESEIIKNQISINVTQFFRDNSPFKYIEQVILPTISKQKTHSPDKTIRILSAACSTGQEPYSLAIIAEFLRKKKIVPLKIAITAVDIDEEALRFAHQGIYDISSMKNVKSRTLQTNFNVLDNGRTQIKKSLKKYVTFLKIDLLNLTKPILPSKKFDLILCRNFLIYISKDKQEEVIFKLTKNLKERGYIMFGKTEGIPLIMQKDNFLKDNLTEHVYIYKNP